MQAQELRIGNYVYLKSKNKIYLISSGYDIDIGTDSEDFDPISLTEDILLKCGFVVFDAGISKKFHIGINPIAHDYLFTLLWQKDINNEQLEGYPFFLNGFFTIKYLHQLQNLIFTLTGQELNINL